MINNFKELSLEEGFSYDYCVDKLNDWYSDKLDINSKIEEVLNQFFITLGPRNWEVRWIGHGLLTEDKVFDVFREHESHRKRIMKLYDKWYYMAVMLASEKHMSKPNF